PERHLFGNAYFTDWLGAVPQGVTLNGTPAVASYTDANSPAEAGLQLTVGANFQGLVFAPTAPAADLQGKWVTLLLEVDTSGVVDPLQTRIYTRDDGTGNSTTGQFAVQDLPITSSGQFRTLAYDVKFADTLEGSPTVIWYIAYSGVSAG